MARSKMAWLDRKISLAKLCAGGALTPESAEHIYEDVRSMLDDSKGRRGFSEAAFVERCKTLIEIVARLRKVLQGRQLEDAGALQDELLNYVTARK